jgi:hypothetical protein
MQVLRGDVKVGSAVDLMAHLQRMDSRRAHQHHSAGAGRLPASIILGGTRPLGDGAHDVGAVRGCPAGSCSRAGVAASGAAPRLLTQREVVCVGKLVHTRRLLGLSQP